VNEIIDGRYTLIERLGAGGMAEVFLAEQAGPRGFARRAVIKRIHAHMADDPVFIGSFEDEARLAAQLQHPNIVRTEDFGEHDGQLYLVLEYVEGVELATLARSLHVAGQALPLRLVVQIGIDIADALHFAHHLCDPSGTPLNIVHRDVSPQNIMLTRTGQGKLLDFGIARAASNRETTEAGKVKGKTAYFSPEQAYAKELDGRTDQFALAIVLYELLARKRLFLGKDLLATLQRVSRCEVPTLCDLHPEVSKELDLVLARALARKRTDRYEDCAAFSEALSSCLAPLGGRWNSSEFARWQATLPEVEKLSGAKSISMLIPATVTQTGVDHDRATRVGSHPFSAPLSPPSHTGASTVIINPLEGGTELDVTVATEALRRGNLGEAVGRFFGRETEITELAEHLHNDQRLITLLGAGGSGKTRLSQFFGAWQRSQFAGGVWFCDLSEAHSKAGILTALAAALDVALTDQEPARQLAHAIAGRGRTLIILDNFEQLLDHAPDTLSTWLAQAPEAVFLVTSRSRLRIAGECLVILDPLPIAEAMRLFADRSTAAEPSFKMTEANQPIIKSIVERLDCTPLAVELAAARVAMMPPEQILERLSQRFVLLRGQRRDQNARQATLRGAIDWSWNLLEPHEQSTLGQLAIFHGGCTLDAAEAVVDLSAHPDEGDVMDSVAALVDHSLLRRIEPHPGHVRYRMLESVLAYATEKLGDAAAAVALRHAQYFAIYGHPEFLDSLDTHGGVPRRQRLALELENLATGVHNALAADEFGLAAHCGLAAGAVFGQKGPYLDGISLLNRVPAERLDANLQARFVLHRAQLMERAGQYATALAGCEQALATYQQSGHRRGVGRVLSILAKLHKNKGRAAEAFTHYERGLVLARETGDRRNEGIILGNLGNLHYHQGRNAVALMHYEQALTIAREVGNRSHENNTLGNLGTLHSDQGRIAEGLSYYQQALSVAREVGDHRGEVIVLGNLGLLHHDQGRSEQGLKHYKQALIMARKIGNRYNEGLVLGNLGDLHYDSDDLAAAERYLQQAVEMNDEGFPAVAGAFRGTLALIRAEAGALEEARALLKKGDSQTRGVWTFELAKLLCKRARVEQRAGDTDAAAAALAEAETIATEVGASTDSDLGQEIAKARAALAGPEPR
jgi:predicted ATPase/serine/threonine protein kinase